MLVEFPADDPERALRFWEGVLGDGARAARAPSRARAGRAAATGRPSACTRGPRVRATGSHSPTSRCPTWPAALERVTALGGAVIHAGERWAICRDSEGSPFGLGPVS